MKKVSLFGLFVLCSICMLLVVHAATTDVKGPTLKSVSLKYPNKEYQAGDRIYLNLDANDDISGISSINAGINLLERYDENNNLSGGDAEVYDLDSNPYIQIPYYLPDGKWEINQFTLIDNAFNYSQYLNWKDGILSHDDYYLPFNLEFVVKTTKKVDKNAPVVKSVSIDKTKVKYGDSITLSANVVDDMSGVKWVDAYFIDPRNPNGEQIVVQLVYDKNDNFKGTLKSPIYNGNYKLSYIIARDMLGNQKSYVSGKDIPEISFTVVEAPDRNPVVKINNMKYDNKKIVAPYVYKLSIDLNDETNLIDSIDVYIENENKKSVQMFLKKDKSGLFTGYLDIDQYKELGKYYLMGLSVYNSNDDIQGKNDALFKSINNSIKYDKVELFELVENKAYDVITSTTDKELINKIKSANDSAKIAINSSNSSILKKEVFKAIKGTNKTIYIESNGIQWVFNGKNIKKCKDIDVSVSLNYIYDDELNDELKDIINKGLVINFADNGQLPGKALIRVKTDYALRDYLGIEDLYAYYYNGSKEDEKFDAVAGSIKMTEDGYLEFYIDHNSSFVLTNEVVDEKYVSDVKDDLALNDKDAKEALNVEKNVQSFNYITLFVVIGVIAIIVVVSIIVGVNYKKRKKSKNNCI